MGRMKTMNASKGLDAGACLSNEEKIDTYLVFCDQASDKQNEIKPQGEFRLSFGEDPAQVRVQVLQLFVTASNAVLRF